MMDSQTLLMKRLATASHQKIYPSTVPKSEMQLRRTLLTTRLWNQVCRQQQDDWLVSQREAAQDDEWAWFTDTIQQEEESCDWPWLDHEENEEDEEDCATRKRSSAARLTPRKRIKPAVCTPPAGPESPSTVLLSA